MRRPGAGTAPAQGRAAAFSERKGLEQLTKELAVLVNGHGTKGGFASHELA